MTRASDAAYVHHRDAKEHVRVVMAREYWRCLGLAENARVERKKLEADVAEFAREEHKWGERASAVLAKLDGKVPENPLPGSVE